MRTMKTQIDEFVMLHHHHYILQILGLSRLLFAVFIAPATEKKRSTAALVGTQTKTV